MIDVSLVQCVINTSCNIDNIDFIKKIKHLSINPEEETLVSFHVSALFTIIPVPDVDFSSTG